MLLIEFLEKVYVPHRLLGASKLTISEYRSIIFKFGEYVSHQPRLHDLTDDNVVGFMASYLNAGRSVFTANKCRQHLLALWHLAYKRRDSGGERFIAQPPEVDKLREPKLQSQTWTPEQFGQLLAATENCAYTLNFRGLPDSMYDGYGGIGASQWWKALLLLLYYTGLRISAALSIRKEDCQIGESESWVFAPWATQKHRADQRFKLPADATAALRAIVGKGKSDKLFPYTMTIQSIHHKFTRILKRAGLPHGRKDKFHNIRRLSATGVAAKLGRSAAMDHLGHSCMKVTERYLDYRQIPRINAADVLPTPVIPVTAVHPKDFEAANKKDAEIAKMLETIRRANGGAV